MAEKEELKSLLMKVKEDSEKADLKLNTQKLRSWHPVPPPQGKIKTGNSSRFYFFGSKTTAMVTPALKLKDVYSLEKKL